MELTITKETVEHAAVSGFAATAGAFLADSLGHMVPWLMASAGAFLADSLGHMVPWLMASAAVIVCDLCFGIRKSMLMGEEVRASRAIRRTMGKMVTYFSFVCMVCMVEVAAGSAYGIDRWACLLVCGIEFMSIISNILKPKGYSLNVKALVAAVFGRALGGSKKEYEDIIKKE